MQNDMLNTKEEWQDIKENIDLDEFVTKKMFSKIMSYINDNTKILDYLGEEGLISGIFHRRAILDEKKHLNILSKIYKAIWDEDNSFKD